MLEVLEWMYTVYVYVRVYLYYLIGYWYYWFAVLCVIGCIIQLVSGITQHVRTRIDLCRLARQRGQILKLARRYRQLLNDERLVRHQQAELAVLQARVAFLREQKAKQMLEEVAAPCD